MLGSGTCLWYGSPKVSAEVSIIYASYKFGAHTRNIKYLISKFESANKIDPQRSRISQYKIETRIRCTSGLALFSNLSFDTRHTLTGKWNPHAVTVLVWTSTTKTLWKNVEFLRPHCQNLYRISARCWNAVIAMTWKIDLKQERHRGERSEKL